MTLTSDRMQEIMLEVDLGKKFKRNRERKDTPEEKDFRSRINKNMEDFRKLGRKGGVTMHFTPEFPDLD